MPPGPESVPPTDEELARRAQQGCSASFEELVRRFQVPLLHFLRQRTGDEDAEDLVQDTFIRAYQNIHRYRPAWRFATWLFTIARRLSMNRQRRKQPLTGSEALDLIEAGTPQPVQVVVEEESRRHLWNLADTILTEPQMTAVWLYYVEDLPVKQIARVLGRSGVAVKTILFRARKRLLPILVGWRSGSTEEDRPATPKKKAVEFTNG